MREHSSIPIHIFLLLTQALFTHAKSLNVTWIRPVQGSVYSTGHFVIGEWTTSKAVASPSFKLCQHSGSQKTKRTKTKENDDCGETVWPHIKHASGSYVVSLKVPSVVSTQDGMFLQMKDDFGAIARSPTFTLSLQGSDLPSISAQDAPAGSSPTTTSSPSTSKIKSKSKTVTKTKTKTTASKSNASSSSDLASVAAVTATSVSRGKHSSVVTQSRAYTQSHSNIHTHPTISATIIAGAVAAPPSLASSSGIAPSPLHSSQIAKPNITLTRSPAPTVALAIPLSLLGLVVIASALLAIHHHRSIIGARRREADMLDSGMHNQGASSEKNGDLDDINFLAAFCKAGRFS
ncbi:hypothetical protein BJ138DRAFT_318793 [Hygrophoropsis aurantiaca]|uniref:Uncharacterized protein n=1 Tax=Hygrophoropsis aurantiaca TaxID=72124 RepID=A0ACB8A6Q3_9AGAM|nr:hypothetical protein BJ138DRAFT_318793 [Hygrophoropsis aurantiaca]